jgi:hypothetical protein
VRNQAFRALAILAVVLPIASSQVEAKTERREPGMRWVEDLEAAIQEAKDRNIPIFVAYHKDH